MGAAKAIPGAMVSMPAGSTTCSALCSMRVALFFFDGDIFDPGGGAPIADEILDARGLAHLVVDRPAGLLTHWASITPAFTAERRWCASRSQWDCRSFQLAA